MSNVFVFNPDEFKLIFPEFKNIPNGKLQFIFETAENSILDNSAQSCIPLEVRKKLFMWLVAHMAALQDRIDSGNSSLVGRVNSATEGSVSIGTDFNGGATPTAQWLNQTPYGAQYYILIRPYLSAVWVAGTKPMPVKRNRWFGRLWG